MNSEMSRQGFDVNVVPVDGGASLVRSLSPSSMQVEVPWIHAVDQEASEDEENGGGRVRKKLRLSKKQSAFLEDSFKEHSTLTMVCVLSFSAHLAILLQYLIETELAYAIFSIYFSK
jgi:homeobox-leucine zipper protein